MGKINIQSTDLSHKAGLTYTGTSDKTIDVDSLVTKVSSTDNAIARFDGTGGAIQNSSVYIDDSGNVGIGTSSPSGRLHVRDDSSYTGKAIFQTTDQRLTIGTYWQGGVGQYAYINSSSSTETVPKELLFMTGLTERMRIDYNGNLLVGTTSTVGSAKQTISTYGNSGVGLTIQNDGATTTGSVFAKFYWNTGQLGSIVGNGSSTAYNTSSDYRLKENVQPMHNALNVVQQLNPVTYTWKANGSQGQGFIAHELQAIVPECVTGEKDAVDEEGKPVYQGIDTSFLVATLTKAIQELKAEVDDLKAQLEAK